MKKKELNIEEIKNLIPHRYPFLLIDKLIDIIPNTSATGIKNVTFKDFSFQINALESDEKLVGIIGSISTNSSVEEPMTLENINVLLQRPSLITYDDVGSNISNQFIGILNNFLLES